MAACDRLIFEAYADWYMMHAELEGMPFEHWRALAKGQADATKLPEIKRSIELLRRAAGSFRAGAQGSKELLEHGRDPLGRPLSQQVRASIETNIKAYHEISGKIDDMAATLEKAQAPSTEHVQGIEQLMTRQHGVMDQRSRDLGVLAELRKG